MFELACYHGTKRQFIIVCGRVPLAYQQGKGTAPISNTPDLMDLPFFCMKILSRGLAVETAL